MNGLPLLLFSIMPPLVVILVGEIFQRRAKRQGRELVSAFTLGLSDGAAIGWLVCVLAAILISWIVS